MPRLAFYDALFLSRTGSLEAISSQVGRSVAQNTDVIVLDYNKPALAFFAAFCASFNIAKNRKVLLVENGCNPHFVSVLQDLVINLSNVEVVAFDRNRYFGEGNNLAAERCDSEFICFLNNDAFLPPGAIDRLEQICSAENVAAAGPLFYNNDKFVVEAGGIISACGGVLQKGKGIKLERYFDHYIQKVNEVDYISAACMVVKAEFWRKSGGFDYIYEPFYYEDTDLCMRAKALGWSIVCDSETHVLHYENFSTAEFFGGSVAEAAAANRVKFFNRWAGFSSADLDHPGGQVPRSVRTHTQKKKSYKSIVFNRTKYYNP